MNALIARTPSFLARTRSANALGRTAASPWGTGSGSVSGSVRHMGDKRDAKKKPGVFAKEKKALEAKDEKKAGGASGAIGSDAKKASVKKA